MSAAEPTSTTYSLQYSDFFNEEGRINLTPAAQFFLRTQVTPPPRPPEEAGGRVALWDGLWCAHNSLLGMPLATFLLASGLHFFWKPLSLTALSWVFSAIPLAYMIHTFWAIRHGALQGWNNWHTIKALLHSCSAILLMTPLDPRWALIPSLLPLLFRDASRPWRPLVFIGAALACAVFLATRQLVIPLSIQGLV